MKNLIKKRIEVYNPNDFAINFSDSIAKPNYIEAILEEKTIAPKSTISVDLFYYPELKQSYGYSLDNVRFFTDTGITPELDLSITANIYSKKLKTLFEKSPRIWTEKDTLSLGKVFSNGPYIVQFAVYNKGGKSLKLDKIVPTTGCEILSISKQQLQPGEYSNIRIKVKDIANDGGGTKFRKVEIISDDPLNPTTTIMIKAEVIK